MTGVWLLHELVAQVTAWPAAGGRAGCQVEWGHVPGGLEQLFWFCRAWPGWH